MKLKRILAWIIDWNISGIPALLYALIFRKIAEAQSITAIGALIFVFLFYHFLRSLFFEMLFSRDKV